MKHRILPFAFAGAVGFVVDAGLLLLLNPLLGPFAGRLFSFLGAVLTTWVINRNFAFADRAGHRNLLAEFVRYVLAMLPGAAVNWLAYTITIALAPPGPVTLTLAVAAGSLAGMATNLTAANFWVFKAPR